jgi:hypothetical protein
LPVERVSAQGSPPQPNFTADPQQILLSIPGVKKAVERLVSDLPINLNGSQSFGLVTPEELPGGSFHPVALHLSPSDVYRPLPPGDYTFPVVAFCHEYSVHQPGSGTPYVLEPLQGADAAAISALMWRGTLKKLAPAPQLKALTWSIEAGVPYDQLPPEYKQLVDSIIPEYRDQLRGDKVQELEATYAKLTRLPRMFNKAVPATLEEAAGKLGVVGQIILTLESTHNHFIDIFRRPGQPTSAILSGQASPLSPVHVAGGSWSAVVPGRAYTRFTYVGGNLARDNVLELRVLPPSQADAHAQSMKKPVGPTSSAAPAGSQDTGRDSVSIGSALQSPDAQGQMGTGTVGAPQGAGQHLSPVPVTEKVDHPCDNPKITNVFPHDKSYHSYDPPVKNLICLKSDSGCTIERVFETMISQEQFIAPTYASDTSPVLNCKTAVLPGNNPIQTVIDRANFSITNYALPGHSLYPGEVTRQIVSDGNEIDVITTGQGNGSLGSLNNFFADPLWSHIDTRLRDQFVRSAGHRQ